ncbi:MAG: hypothetical protein JWO15_739 [Sphingomonadales bacterium]|nr:hypothetical protein [Sphingomonadales bacterium]
MTGKHLLLMILAASFSLGIMFWPSPALAACGPCSCNVSATPVNFGTYSPVSSSDTVSTGNIRVQCTLLIALGGSYTIDLSTGSGTYAQRTLVSGGSVLRYNLYTTVSNSLIWGNDSGGSSRVTESISALLIYDQTLTVYGRIPSGQNVPTGSYADAISVTVTY